MKRLRVFLGGPIQYISQDKGTIVYEKRELIQMLVDTLEMEKYQVFSAHMAEEFGMNIPENKEICQRDYKWMKQCDVFCLILLPDEKGFIRSDGACIELGWAFSLGKPIVILTDPNKFCESSALLQGLIVEADTRIISINDVLNDPKLLICTMQDI